MSCNIDCPCTSFASELASESYTLKLGTKFSDSTKKASTPYQGIEAPHSTVHKILSPSAVIVLDIYFQHPSEAFEHLSQFV